ncbi:MAG: tetratricopeptide repeat protein [candidate division Zixibacteria bacterium]|nr:tetratricopeptide repeat protein [candidate division Zixibacteria bacterium]
MAGSSRKNHKRSRKTSRANGRTRAERAPQQAFDELLADVRRDPQDFAARLAVATFYLTHNLHDKIPEVLEPVQSQYMSRDVRRRIQFDRLLAFGYATTHQFTRAEEAVRRGVSACPDAVDFRFIEAYVAISLGEYRRAVDAGAACLASMERHDRGERVEGDFAVTPAHRSQLLNIIGSAHMDSGSLRDSIAPFEQSIRLDGGNYLPYLNLARAWYRLGERQRARDTVQRGMEACRQVQELRMLAAALQDRPTVSACMIVKNEEELLPGCLASIRDWVDEIVVVDTGSSDRTVAIAESYGARVYHQPWEGDFSKHRNFSIEHATCDWVLIIDADEEFVTEDVSKLKPLLSDERYDIVCLDVFNVYANKPDQVTFLPSMRLFRRRLNLRYEGIVHNQLRVPSDARTARIGVRIKHYGYGLSQEKMRRKVERSRALLEKQLADNPNDPFALFNYAQLLRGKDDFDRDDAERILHAATRVVELTDPSKRGRRHLHLMALDQLAWCNFKLQRYDEALTACDQALEIRPDYLDALLLRGHILSTLQRYEEARQSYVAYLREQAIYEPSKEHDPLILQHVDSRTTAHYGLALLAHDEGRTDEEKKHLQKVGALTPGYMKSALRLGQILLAEGDLAGAETQFRIQRETNREGVEALLGLASVANRRQDAGAAERYLHDVLAIEPANTTALTRLVEICRDSGRYDQAVELLGRASGGPGGDTARETSIAQSYFELGRFREAADHYRRIIERGDAGAETYNDLANCYFKLEELDQAELFYREALSIRPGDYSAARNLGLALARQERYEEAIEFLEAVAGSTDESADLVPVVGDLYRRLGQAGRALSFYERHLATNPGDTLALFHLSECYLALGHTDSARMGYRRILQIDPGFRPAQDRIAALSGAFAGVDAGR